MIKLPGKIRDILRTHGEIPPKEMTMPLFVIGNMRSGTTLLVNKITQHPQLIKIGSELNGIWTRIGGADCLDACEYKSASDADYQYALNMGLYFTRFINESKTIKRHAMRFLNLMQQQQGRVYYDWNHIMPVNKSPHLMNKIGYVHRMFPKSKFILIIRDIYGFSSSMKMHLDEYYKNTGNVYVKTNDEKACWFRMNPNEVSPFKSYPSAFEVIPEMWMRLNSVALKDLINIPSSSFIVVNYTDFVRNQEVQLQRVFDFLNLQVKHKPEEHKICRTVSSYKNTNTTGDPQTKWQKLLSEEEKEIIEKVIEDNQQTYNYIIEKTEQYKRQD